MAKDTEQAALETVKTGVLAVPATLEDFMSTDRDVDLGDRNLEGTEGVGREDMKMPRIVLLQKGSPQCTEGDPKYDENLKPGMMLNDLTGEVYGKGPLYFSIIRRDPPRAMEFAPIDSGGGIIDPDVPIDDERCKFHGQEKPVATIFRDFICVLYPTLEIVVFSFKGGGLAAAKALNGYVWQRKDNLWRGVYQVTTGVKMKPVPHMIFIPKNAGWVKPAIQDQIHALFDQFKDKVIEINRDAVDDVDSFDPATIEATATEKADM
jgi:hypothetical protein